MVRHYNTIDAYQEPSQREKIELILIALGYDTTTTSIPRSELPELIQMTLEYVNDYAHDNLIEATNEFSSLQSELMDIEDDLGFEVMLTDRLVLHDKAPYVEIDDVHSLSLPDWALIENTILEFQVFTEAINLYKKYKVLLLEIKNNHAEVDISEELIKDLFDSGGYKYIYMKSKEEFDKEIQEGEKSA